ncbi:MAG: class I SAM-dependent methyltransferase [Planctomycetota bacterium]
MDKRFELETEHLTKSWTRYDADTLRDYLVQDVEDPRINVQSILTRHFLFERLFGERFGHLMEQELRFGLVVNWLLKLLKKSVNAEQLRSVLDALLTGEDNAEGLEIPAYVSETFDGLAVPNYMCDLLIWAPVETTDAPIPEYLMSTFQAIWHEVLAGEQPERISVLEPACGSANDYRFIDSFGISRLIDYAGFDLCDKNVHNARQMFPDVRFSVGNAIEIKAEDKAFDYCFVHDLFEHLSIEAVEVAIAEICRVTRYGICAGFFNMHAGLRHVVKPVDDYYWNTLSLAETKAVFKQHTSAVRVIHIDAFLRSQFGCADAHNKGAHTLIINV